MARRQSSVADPKPLFFISHKHSDRAIGARIAEFVRTVSGGGVDVHLSSEPGMVGPRAGKEMSAELTEALWRAGVVVLVYTSEDRDWSWCLWECGIAVYPDSPDTKVVVLQCLQDKPEIFAGSVAVQAWEEPSVERFARRFAEPDFFPDLDGPVTGLSEAELVKAARALFEDLQELISREPVENWSAWPFLRIQLSKEVLAELNRTPAKERPAKARTAIVEHGVVTGSSSGTAQLFGLSELPVGTPFSELLDDWTESYPGRAGEWVQVIARQIVDGARRKRPPVENWERFREVGGDAEFVPGVGRVKSDAVSVQFDIYFLGVSRVPDVTTRMTRLERMYRIDLASKPADEVAIEQLVEELEGRGWNRVPVLEDDEPRYIVHVSMIDRFLRKRLYADESTGGLTLEDLLQEPALKEVFSGTWEVVPENASLAEAQAAMRAKPSCEDVFVTRDGSADEPILGWLTNKDLAAALHSERAAPQ